MLTCGLDLTGIAEAETQQDFMDVLDKDVIEPLTALKVRQDRVFCTGILLYFRFDLKFRCSVPNPFKCKREQILHTADPCSLHSRWHDSFSFVLNHLTPFQFVVVCLFLFDCMYLINVAILYKYQPCMPRTIYPVVLFYPFPVCSLALARLALILSRVLD
jgi:hypothetical protein